MRNITKITVGFFAAAAAASFGGALTSGTVALLCLENVIQNHDVKIGAEVGLAVSFLSFVLSVCGMGTANCVDEELERREKKNNQKSSPA